MISDALNKVSDRRSAETQPQIINGNIKALGSTSTRYSVKQKAGGVLTNISGPEGLNVGDSVIVSAYPGRTKKYVILGKAGGALDQETTIVRV